MKRSLLLILLFCATTIVWAQERKYSVNAVAFYNLENLFDTEDDTDNPGDDEFLPISSYAWGSEKYGRKLDNLSRVISRLCREYCPLGPAVIGVAEVENRRVLQDLVAHEGLRDMNLRIVHQDSPDRRGIDVGLLYNPDLFTLDSYRIFPYTADDPRYVSRDHLLVSGTLEGERLHIIVNHWPSRYGGDASSHLREAAARGVNAILDSLYIAEPDAKVVIMGDLNDDPVDKSVREVLGAKRNISDVRRHGLYNPMWKLYEKGIGSLAYQGKWSLFDQIIVSHSLLSTDRSGLTYQRAEVFNRDFLIRKEGRNKGYPHRTFSGSSFIDGYSDHFPVFIYLIKEVAL